ncbi:MAG: hypothetical protein VX523_00340 [Chloroflexota bacterium]|nr:hypothetical protein [Chloroflexota bacterium]
MITQEHKGDYLDYVTSVPDDYSRDKQYRIIILMHGFGANMYDLLTLAPMINQKDFIYVFPNAPIKINMGFSHNGYAWFPIESQNYHDSSKLLNKTIDEVLSKYNSSDVYIGGFSQGGMMAIHSGLFSERAYTGVIALSSKIINIDELIIKQNRPENTGIFISHGKFDAVIDIKEGISMKDKLEDLGFKISFKEYEIGHEINSNVLEDLSTWLSK